MFYFAKRSAAAAAAAAAIRFCVHLDLRKRSDNGAPTIVAGWFAWCCLRPTNGPPGGEPDGPPVGLDQHGRRRSPVMPAVGRHWARRDRTLLSLRDVEEAQS